MSQVLCSKILSRMMMMMMKKMKKKKMMMIESLHGFAFFTYEEDSRYKTSEGLLLKHHVFYTSWCDLELICGFQPSWTGHGPFAPEGQHLSWWTLYLGRYHGFPGTDSKSKGLYAST